MTKRRKKETRPAPDQTLCLTGEKTTSLLIKKFVGCVILATYEYIHFIYYREKGKKKETKTRGICRIDGCMYITMTNGKKKKACGEVQKEKRKEN